MTFRANQNPGPSDEPEAFSSVDATVIAHPAAQHRRTPKCLFRLRTIRAQTHYGDLAGLLADHGRLTIGTHHALSCYSAQYDEVCRTLSEDRPVRAVSFTNLSRAWKELGIVELDHPSRVAWQPVRSDRGSLEERTIAKIEG